MKIAVTCLDGNVHPHFGQCTCVKFYEVEDNKVIVKIGSIDHPMIPEHYIEWVVLQTKKGTQI